jgi:AraC-like DNA-binding protein/mannose-6-phosphate isomerase-like protein (cupin superfamily)
MNIMKIPLRMHYGAKRMDEGDIALPRQHSKFHFDNMHWTDPMRYGPMLLYQIGDLGCDGGYSTGAHKQFCHEISYIVSGKGVFSTDGVEYGVKKGDVYLNRPGEVHDVVADKVDPVRYFYAAFSLRDEEAESGVLHSVVAGLDGVINPCTPDRYDLYTPFVSIFNELINGKRYSESMIESCLRQLIILAFRDYCEGTQDGYAPKPSMERSRQLVYDIVNYIDSNLCKIGDLSDICARFDYSYSYLSHVFSRVMEQSLQEYYDGKRFETAASWLGSGSLSVTDIAEKLHYQSIHSFSRAFRQRFGMSPTQYAKEYRI